MTGRCGDPRVLVRRTDDLAFTVTLGPDAIGLKPATHLAGEVRGHRQAIGKPGALDQAVIADPFEAGHRGWCIRAMNRAESGLGGAQLVRVVLGQLNLRASNRRDALKPGQGTEEDKSGKRHEGTSRDAIHGALRYNCNTDSRHVFVTSQPDMAPCRYRSNISHNIYYALNWCHSPAARLRRPRRLESQIPEQFQIQMPDYQTNVSFGFLVRVVWQVHSVLRLEVSCIASRGRSGLASRSIPATAATEPT